MSKGNLHREFVLAAALLGIAAVSIVAVLLYLLDAPLDPGDVQPAAVRIKTVQIERERPPPPPKPARRAPRPAPEEPEAVPTAATAPVAEPMRLPPAPAKSGRLRGVVQTKEAQAISGARIVVKKGRRKLTEGTSDGEGKFDVGPIAPGHISIEVTHSDYASEKLSRAALPRETITVVLKEGGSIAGRVLDDWSGEPLSRAAIRVGYEAEGGKTDRRKLDQGTRSDEQGVFRIDGIRPGVYQVAGSHRGYAVAAVEKVRVASGEVTEGLEIRLQKEAVVRGTVVNDADGAAIAKALVVFRPPFPAGPRRARTRHDGTFVLKGVSPGRSSLEVSRSGYLTKWVSGLDLTAGETRTDVEIRLQKPGASLDDSVIPRGGRGKPVRRGFQYAGIGAVLRKGGGGQGLVVDRLFPGSSAADAGIIVGERIVEVDGKPVNGKSMGHAVEMLRGQDGAPVTIKVQSVDGTSRLVQPVRRTMTVPWKKRKKG